jgi:hypothetical protein
MHAREAIALFITIIVIAAIAVVLQSSPGVSGFIARPVVNTVDSADFPKVFVLFADKKVVGGIQIIDDICYFWPPDGVGPPSKIGPAHYSLGSFFSCKDDSVELGVVFAFELTSTKGWQFHTINLNPPLVGTAIPY